MRFPHRSKSCLQRHYCNYSWAELSTSVCFIWNLLASEKQQRLLSLSPIKSNSIMLIGLSGIWDQSIISPGRCGDNVPLVFTFLYLTHHRRLTPRQEINQMTQMETLQTASLLRDPIIFFFLDFREQSCHLSITEETSIPCIRSQRGPFIHMWLSLHTCRTNKSTCASSTDLCGSRKTLVIWSIERFST